MAEAASPGSFMVRSGSAFDTAITAMLIKVLAQLVASVLLACILLLAVSAAAWAI